VIAYRSRDYHNGTGSRVFLTENPVCYIFEAARGLLRVVFRRTLDSRDCVVWLELAVSTRVVVVVATPLIPVVVVAATRVLLAIAANGVLLGISLVFFVGP
jgi:hypothetical protein